MSKVEIRQNPGHPKVVEVSDINPPTRVLITAGVAKNAKDFDLVEELNHNFDDAAEESERSVTTYYYGNNC